MSIIILHITNRWATRFIKLTPRHEAKRCHFLSQGSLKLKFSPLFIKLMLLKAPIMDEQDKFILIIMY